jgi:hypothetical protein
LKRLSTQLGSALQSGVDILGDVPDQQVRHAFSMLSTRRRCNYFRPRLRPRNAHPISPHPGQSGGRRQAGDVGRDWDQEAGASGRAEPEVSRLPRSATGLFTGLVISARAVPRQRVPGRAVAHQCWDRLASYNGRLPRRLVHRCSRRCCRP